MKYIIILSTFVMSSFLYSMDERNLQKIGDQIYANETSRKPDLLVFWNTHESFPSLGLGHFIWIPQATSSIHTEQFPELCKFLRSHSVQMPDWLEEDKGAPWASREEFYNDSARRSHLKEMLLGTFALQTQFIIKRHNEQLPKMMSAIPSEQQAAVRRFVEILQGSARGMYPLIDYAHFKGWGTNEKEQAHNQGWGLLQVLCDNPSAVTPDNASRVFAASAAFILAQRVKNSDPDFMCLRFLPGWINRCMTYANPILFD